MVGPVEPGLLPIGRVARHGYVLIQRSQFLELQELARFAAALACWIARRVR
jgi:hypothetical protein